jgi:phage baseplate assembly protein W
MAQEVYYSDIDMVFNIHPVKEDLVISTNEAAIIRSVKNLVLTNHYERLFQSEVGSNISKMLFELISPLTANIVQREIFDVINTFEPRITNLKVDVDVSPDELSLIATIQFYIKNYTTSTVVEMVLERIR